MGYRLPAWQQVRVRKEPKVKRVLKHLQSLDMMCIIYISNFKEVKVDEDCESVRIGWLLSCGQDK